MPDAFLRLPAGDRREALAVAAAASGRPVHLLEKDVWVVWTLEVLFNAPFAEQLVFKGGTSLSKAYRIIRRFSEDIDITYDIRAIVPELVGPGRGNACLPTPGRSAASRWGQDRHRL